MQDRNSVHRGPRWTPRGIIGLGFLIKSCGLALMLGITITAVSHH